MVIKTTIVVGYMESVRKEYGSKNVVFSPDFLRESKALYDNVYSTNHIDGATSKRTCFAHYMGR